MATEELRAAKRSAQIEIGVTFAVASFWLLPRLPRFRALYPDIDVRVVASDRGFEKIAHQVDAGIAFGLGNWPGFRSILLREGEVFPVCSPAYLRQRPHLARVEQLLHEALLSMSDDRPGVMDWPLWFAEQGFGGYSSSNNLQINSHPLLMQAAREGQGIALGWGLLCDDLLERGDLVRPLDATVRTARGFYFVTSGSRFSEEVRVFRGWVLEQLGVAAPADDDLGA